MKNIYKSLLLIVGAAIVFAACKKFDSLPYYNSGTATVLTASTTAISSAPADSANAAITLSWTNPHYATDSASQKFIIEIDSSGRNFAHESIKTVSGALSTSFTAAELNTIVAGFSFKPDSTYTLDMRVKSSYANNNEQYSSNVVTVTVTPYIVPVTLTPSSTNALALSITNAANPALTFGWTASKFGATTIYYALQIDTAGGNFAAPQVTQYGSTVLSSSLSVGDLNTALLNLGVTAGTTATATFRIAGYLDATYAKPSVFSNTVTVSVQTYIPLLYIYVPGDYQGWHPENAPAIASTVPDLTAYEGYIYIPAGGSYEFKITPEPNWDASYGTNDPIALGTGSDTSVVNSSMSLSGSNNLNVKQLGGGYYRINASTSTNLWTADRTTWAVIGDATANGWGSDTPMTFDAASNTWTVTTNLSASGSFKFRANKDWGDSNHNFGIDGKGKLAYNAGNISVSSSGDYIITLNLSNARQYTYTLTKK